MRRSLVRRILFAFLIWQTRSLFIWTHFFITLRDVYFTICDPCISALVPLLNWLIMLRLSNADAKFICYFMLISFHFIWRTYESQARVIYDTGIKRNESSRTANKARLSFIPFLSMHWKYSLPATVYLFIVFVWNSNSRYVITLLYYIFIIKFLLYIGCTLATLTDKIFSLYGTLHYVN